MIICSARRVCVCALLCLYTSCPGHTRTRTRTPISRNVYYEHGDPYDKTVRVTIVVHPVNALFHSSRSHRRPINSGRQIGDSRRIYEHGVWGGERDVAEECFIIKINFGGDVSRAANTCVCVCVCV